MYLHMVPCCLCTAHCADVLLTVCDRGTDAVQPGAPLVPAGWHTPMLFSVGEMTGRVSDTGGSSQVALIIADHPDVINCIRLLVISLARDCEARP
jgi:hypothetical protein